MVHHLAASTIISSSHSENEYGSGESFAAVRMDTAGKNSLSNTVTERPLVEQIVIGNLRVWHVAGMIMGAVLIVIISLCCLFKCRIPRSDSLYKKQLLYYIKRTRKEIEANAARRRGKRAHGKYR